MISPLRQTFFIPKPSLTENNCPDQSNRVHIVTGGYTGVGKELVRILYSHNAVVYIASRNSEKAKTAIQSIKAEIPVSNGKIDFLQVDFSDLSTVKPAVEEFLQKEQSLHVLTLNAGVMFASKALKSAQGHDIQMATNCLGSHLLYSLLRPVLITTAKNSVPASVRVTWAGSIAVDTMAPKGGIQFIDGSNEPNIEPMNEQQIYAVAKVGNLWLANAHGRRDAQHGILHVCWNPGNLRTELTRHSSLFQRAVFQLIMNPPIKGAYTELYSAVSDDLSMEHVGQYIVPWGRPSDVREDVGEGCLPSQDGKETGSERFVSWCDQTVADFKSLT